MFPAKEFCWRLVCEYKELNISKLSFLWATLNNNPFSHKARCKYSEDVICEHNNLISAGLISIMH